MSNYRARFETDPRGPDSFAVVRFDEGGEQKSRDNDNLRLVCNLLNGNTLVLWGQPGNRLNIATVLNTGSPPLVVEAKWCEPSPDHARKYGHSHWVPDNTLIVVRERSAKCHGARRWCIGCDNDPCIWSRRG